MSDSRKFGARVAEKTVWAMCGTLVLLVIPHTEVLVAALLAAGVLALGIAGLIWLSGGGRGLNGGKMGLPRFPVDRHGRSSRFGLTANQHARGS